MLDAAGDSPQRLEMLAGRRLTGEPLAWITGRTEFCGVQVRIDPGVYVPRWQSEPLARRGVERLPSRGVAIDLCTGSGAVARVLLTHRPDARVVAGDLDGRAVACARSNGVEVYQGNLFDPLPQELSGQADLVTAVVPYVPTLELPRLQRDTFTFESPLAYDGGPDGTAVLRRVLADGVRYLKPGGAILLELGGRQADQLAGDLARLGYVDVRVLRDDEDDVRGIEASFRKRPNRAR